MHVPKKYFHDKLILLLVSVTLFLVLLCCTLILLRSGVGGEGGVYIVEYRDNQGVNAFKRDGSILTIFSFMLFAGVVATTNILLSIRTYRLRRTLSVTILACGILVLLLAVIVSNLLLVYS